jgi:hypothetical protein
MIDIWALNTVAVGLTYLMVMIGTAQLLEAYLNSKQMVNLLGSLGGLINNIKFEAKKEEVA